jgi:hypothetical protein
MSPMNKADYHKDWDWISRQIRDQAGNRCEHCGVVNGANGARTVDDVWYDERAIHGMNWLDGMMAFGGRFPTMRRIVLTVAHYCDETQCIDPCHLVALCQRCHFALDRRSNLVKAAVTRERKRREAEARRWRQERFT